MKVALSSLVTHNIITPREKKSLEQHKIRFSVKEKKGEIIAKAKADKHIEGIKKLAVRVVKNKKHNFILTESKGIQKSRGKSNKELAPALSSLEAIVRDIVTHYKELKQ